MIKIFNEDCRDTLARMIEKEEKVNLVITSPPYNTQRGKMKVTEKGFKEYDIRYDKEMPNMSEEEYINFTVELFKQIDKILVFNGVILWNMSYGTDTHTKEGQNLLWILIAELIKRTNFSVADRIIWKKRNALPNNMSRNKLTRIVEDIFVFVREKEYKTFFCNKEVIGKLKGNQNLYSVIYNYIEAPNNDGTNPYNKATYSSELVSKLLNIYGKRNDESFVVYDPFGGTGTTLKACKEYGISGIMSEISENQCKYAEERIGNYVTQLSLIE